MKPMPPWEEESGVKILRLYKIENQRPDWSQDVNKPHLHPDWPRIVILDLTADQFKKFDQNPLAFAKEHKLYPEEPLRALSRCAKPPKVKGNPGSENWTVVIIHTRPSIGSCAAGPQNTTG